MRAAEARECGHEIDAAAVGHTRGERFDFAGVADDPEPVSQPLHDCARDEHAAFERVLIVVSVARRRWSASRCREGDRAVARGHQQEAARSVGVLRHARLEARLAEQRGLLIAGNAGDRDLVTVEYRADAFAGESCEGTMSGRHASGTSSIASITGSHERVRRL